VFFVLCTSLAFAQDLRSKLKSQIELLRTAAAAVPTNDEDGKQIHDDVTSLLTRAEASVAAGRMYLATDEIGRATTELRAFEYSRQQKDYNTALSHERPILVSLDADARKQDWSRSPAAMRALAEAAQGQSLTLVEASKAYANVTSQEAGLYYLGEAKADTAFASFVHNLGATAKRTPFAPHPVAAELTALQQQVTDSFKPPASIEQHRLFIRLNSTLKLARELDSAGLRYGAAYQYLAGVQQFGMLSPAPPESERAGIREKLAAVHKRFSDSHADDSLALMFVERADEALAAHDGKPSDGEWSAIAAIANRVLPAYDALLRAPAVAPARSNAAVTLTLVRWPYT
jgi:hypothetical protein